MPPKGRLGKPVGSRLGTYVPRGRAQGRLKAPQPRVVSRVPSIIPSRPVPPPTRQYIGGAVPRQPPPDEQGPTPWDKLFGQQGGLFGDPVKEEGPPANPESGWLWDEDKIQARKVADAKRKQNQRVKEITDRETRPLREELRHITEQLEYALKDNVWTPEERVALAQAYQQYRYRNAMGDENERQINNYAVISEYRALIKQAKEEETDRAGEGVASWIDEAIPDGDPYHTYEGKLFGNSSDFFANLGVIIDADEKGFYRLVHQDDLYTQIKATMRKDPAAAGAMIMRLAAWGAYGGAAEKYAPQNVVFDSNMNPIAARWTKDDDQALQQFLTDVAIQQSTGDSFDTKAWDELLDEVAQQNEELAQDPGFGMGPDQVDQAAQSGYGGYGGGGYGYGGGGGYGGGTGGVSYTDPNQLKQLLNGVARARLGMVLSEADVAAFVSYYHQQEAAFVNARMAGQSAAQLDPESQAAAWIESKFRDSMGAFAAGNYVQQLAQFLMSGGMAAGAIGS